MWFDGEIKNFDDLKIVLMGVKEIVVDLVIDWLVVNVD